MTKRFVFDLDDERREKLEAYRARRGLRSFKEALHDLIDGSGELEGPEPPRSSKEVLAEVRATAKRVGERLKAAQPPKTPAKPPKPSGEAVSQTVGRSKLDTSGVDIHPSLQKKR